MLCVCAVVSLQEWRPSKHALYPRKYRLAIRCLAVLAKARTRDARSAAYSKSCLVLLPEELLQYLFAMVTSWPVVEGWLRHFDNPARFAGLL